MVTGFLEKYVRTTLRKVWQELDFLNLHTDGAFKHLRQKTNTDMKKVASKIDKDGNESGWKSTIEGITADTPDKLRGDRVDNIYFEESGNHRSLIETYSRAHALVDILGSRVGNRFVFGCVCKGTKVWTRTGEYKNIEDLHQVDGIIGFKDGKANIEPISYMQEEAYKPCVRITFRDGTFLECSEDHPILMRTLHTPRNKNNRNKRDRYFTWDFVPAKDVGSYQQYNIAGTCRTIDIFGTDTLFDPYLVGLLIGDGSYGYDNTPCLSNCDPEVLDYVKSKYKWSLNAEHITKDNKLYQEIRIKGICPELRKIGIYGQTKTKKRLPDCYQTLDKENARQLIAGLFDTDGYISKTETAAVLYQSTREILEQVQILLYKFGVYATIKKIDPDVRPGRKDKNPWYALSIRDYESFYNFAANIPLRIGYKKQALLTQHPRLDKHEVAPGIREVAVAKVESIGVQRIYNLTACDSHTYLANNVITHNTSGEQGPQLAGLKTMFFNPKSYTILPYLNRHMANGEPQLTGYFIPSYSMWLGKPVGSGFDDRGVVYIEKAKKYYEDHWKTIDDPKALLIDKAEYCFTPEDAFVLEGSNRFDQELLVDQLHALTIHKTVELPKPARLSWGRTKDGEVDRDTRPVLEMVDKSPLEICELPILDEYGIPYSNLYVAAADSIDADSTTSTGQTDVSEFCIVILRRQFGLQPPKIVAIYKERPKHIQTAFDNAMKLCQFFNCKLLFEATRVSIKTYFEHHKKLNLLMTRPRATSNTTTRTNLKQYGVPATSAIIDHQLDLIEQFIVDYSTGIQFPRMIDELMRYSYENKRKFDIVAALGIVLLAEEEMTGRVAKPSQPYKPNWGISYVKNQYGQIEITTGDDKKREIGTGGSRDHIMPVQTSVYQSPGGSFWRR